MNHDRRSVSIRKKNSIKKNKHINDAFDLTGSYVYSNSSINNFTFILSTTRRPHWIFTFYYSPSHTFHSCYLLSHFSNPSSLTCDIQGSTALLLSLVPKVSRKHSPDRIDRQFWTKDDLQNMHSMNTNCRAEVRCLYVPVLISFPLPIFNFLAQLFDLQYESTR